MKIKRIVSIILILAFTIGLIPITTRISQAADYKFSTIPNTCTENYDSVIDTSKANYSYDEMLEDINLLVAKFPGKVKKEIIGYSELGREIPALIIGSDNAPNRYLAQGATNARDYMTSLFLMKVAEYYLENYSNSVNGEVLADLFNRCQFHFIPMVNPDGVMLSQEGLDSLNIITDPVEKQRRTESLLSMMDEMNAAINGTTEVDTGWSPPDRTENETDFTYWVSNIDGVDVNFNMYDAQMDEWLKGGAYYNDITYHNKPYYKNYMAQPESSKEAKALATYCRRYNFNIATAYQIPGNLFHWNWLDRDPARKAKHLAISQRLASFAGYTCPTGNNPYVGFTGWYLKNFPDAYATAVKIGNRVFFDKITEPENLLIKATEKPNDNSPLEIEQFTTDVKAGTSIKYSIWNQKFTPIYTVQYILSLKDEENNPLIPPSGHVRTEPQKPAISAVTAGDGQASISFIPPENDGGMMITGYKLYQSTDNINFEEVSSNMMLSGNTFEVYELLNGTTYYFKVAAENMIGTGELSEVSQPVTPMAELEGVPGKPSIIEAITDDSMVAITFAPNPEDDPETITGYKIFQSTDNVTYIEVTDNVTLSMNKFIVKGLTNGTNYYFKVAAVNDIGTGKPSEPSAALTPVALTTLNIPNTCVENYDSVVDVSKAKYSYNEMLEDIDLLLAKFPGKVKKEIVGYSELGREIPALIIGSDSAPNRYLAQGASHAREYIASQLIVKMVEFYLENYDNEVGGEKLSDLFQRCQFHFIPMHNPDGVMLSQQGLESLNIITDPEEKQRRIDFLVPLMEEMNAAVNANSAEKDSDWAPPAEGEYDFTYWKSNINGVDVHYNMYDDQMMEWLLGGTFIHDPKNASYTEKPYYMNYMDQPESQKESKALADYCKKNNFNIAISYHATGGIYQWNYGFKKELPFETVGEVRQQKHQLISDRLATFMDHSSSQGYNAHIGFNGWYLHMFPRAYSANVELGTRVFLKDVTGPEGVNAKENDGCPLEVEQLTTDVSTGTFTRYSIWTKQKFTPIYTVQYILNNDLVEAAIATPAAPRDIAATVNGNTAEITFAVSADTGGSEITGYKLYQSTDNTDFTDVTASATLEGNKFVVPGLAYNTKYYFKVSLVNSMGEGEKSPETAEVTTGEAPPVVSPPVYPIPQPEDATPVQTVNTEKSIEYSIQTNTVTDENGKASSLVSVEQIDKAIKELSDPANSSKIASIKIATNVEAEATQSEVTIPSSAFALITGSNVSSISVDTGIGEVTFDKSSLATINKSIAEDTGDINISVSKLDIEEVINSFAIDKQSEIQEKIGDRPVFDFNVTAAGRQISDFEGGTARVSVPYTPKAGEDLDAIVVCYVADNGDLIIIPNCIYDSETGIVSFTVKHFSKYAVGYNKVSFNDVSGNWAEEYITYLSSRNIICGDNNNYKPEALTRRSEFAKMLALAAGEDVSGYSVSEFIDVDINSWYGKFVAWASEKGITKGKGNNIFDPDASISREEIVTMLYRLAGYLNYELSESTDLIEFPDSNNISSWAKKGAEAAVRAGIISGKDGKFAPADYATRSEVAKMITVFLKGMAK